MKVQIRENNGNAVGQKPLAEIPLTTEQQTDVLRSNWLSHDARWQMAVFQQFGWDAGNRLNKEVARQVGKVAMQRLMKHLGVTRVNDLHELREVCENAMSLFFPPPGFEHQFEQLSDTELLGTIRRCGTYDNVKRANVEKHYECGCFAMRAGWYAALGVDVEETLGKCLKTGDGRCDITLHMKSWGNTAEQVRDIQKEED
ncbi:MAG: hypothetical protein RBG13Loki_3515 [Promethearchaeota archaeon CR_4]|nr:MAG: hypothetical protein RBG13Loki_3515 [Candidatus Lokiarchaeota archaeon CR_4]